jgi:hypothetical protein
MATFHEIFLRSLAADTDLVADVEHVLAVPLRRDLESPYIGGAQVSDDIVVEVLEDMALEDDGDMPLSTHPGLIIVRSLSKDQKAELAAATALLDGLKNTGRYSLFLSLDAQVLIKSAIVNTAGGE